MRKKIMLTLITLTLLLTCINIFYPREVKADSGLDTSYDSDYHMSSNDDWPSDNDRSNDNSSRDNRNRDSYKESFNSTNSSNKKSYSCDTDTCKQVDKVMSIIAISIILIVPSLIVIVIIIEIIRRIKRLGKNYDIESSTNIGDELYYKIDLTEEDIRKTLPGFNKEEFLKEAYNIYLKVQEDWMNFNYKGLRENLTDELYNQYIMQLDILKEKNRKNIMRDFKMIESIITEISEENERYTIVTEMIISFIDYIEENDIVIRGDALNPITIHYKMSFVSNKNSIDACPYCGAPLKQDASQICEYCRGKIDRVGSKWILSKKESLKQR